MELAVEGLGKDYGAGPVLDDVSFRLGAGQVLALIGPNGSGKSTLIKTIATILPQTSGTIRMDGEEIRTIDPLDLAKRIGYVPQSFSYTLYATVFETVLMGRRRHIRWSVPDEELARVQRALDVLEMGRYADRFMDQLSGGERQKVFIARSLAQDPELFLFDEPTSALDIRYQIGVMETMRRITRERGSSLIVAVHDLNIACRYADRVLVLDHGRVAGFGAPEVILTPACIRTVYGVDALVAETPEGRFLLPFRARQEG